MALGEDDDGRGGRKVKRLLFLVGCILLGVSLLIGTIFAVEIGHEAAMFWDDPGFAQGYAVVSSTVPVSYVLYIDVNARTTDGDVLVTQIVESECGAEPSPGAGQCGPVISWDWETDFFEDGVEIFEYICPHWVPVGCSPCPPEVFGVYIPPGCVIPTGTCTITLELAHAGTILIPRLNPECATVLEGCGATQDAEGWWLIGSFIGTGSPPIYLPILMKGQ